VATGTSGLPAGAENGEVKQLAAHLSRWAPPPVITELGSLAGKLVEVSGAAIDLQRWLTATDLSASRAALVVTGDLEAAARVIWTEE
jgi:hypothetical protein